MSSAPVPASVVAHLIESLGREGYPVADWASRAGLVPPRGSDATVAFAAATAFIAQVVTAMPDRPIGLEVGGRPLLQSFGMLGVAMQTADDVASAIDAGLHLQTAAGSLVDFRLVSGEDTVVLTVTPRTDDRQILPFLCEEALLSCVTLLRSALHDEDVAPVAVELAYPAPSYADQYAPLLGCPVRFGADRSALIVPRSLLRRRLPRREPAVHAAALAVCRKIAGSAPDQREVDFRWSVEQLLRADLRRTVTMAGLARQLGTTERTLRRRLAEQGETFRRLHARVRREQAEDLLQHTDLPVRAVAAEVGFADVRDFRRAFVQWTGRSPGTARTRDEPGR
ncbi:AraC family transcriptional regulator [Tsukamurella serpentis]